MKIKDCKTISLPRINDPRGNLTFIENANQIPFDIKRVYYLYDIPQGAMRGAHSHKNLEQLIIATSGKFEVTVDDGFNKKTYQLNDPATGLYIPKLIWRDMINFTSDAVCMVLASEKYDESDYIRNYQDFIKIKKK